MTFRANISRWFGFSSVADASNEAVQPRPAPEAVLEANSRQVVLADDAAHSFVRRDAVLDQAGKVAAYEFSLAGALQRRIALEQGAAHQAYDSALLARLVMQGGESLLGDRLGFVCLSAHSLANPLVFRLPPRNTVLMLELDAQSSTHPELPARMAALNAAGLVLGLKLMNGSEPPPELLGNADFVQVDTRDFNGLDLREVSRHLKGLVRSGRPSLKLLATHLLTADDFRFCCKCGFDYFQGPFIASRENLQASSGKINRMALLPILNMLMNERSFADIAEQLKNEPTLSYKLLRYLNSAACGMSKPVEDLGEALMLIGREKFYRWTSMLFFDFAQPSYQERVVAERALVRARTLELLAGKGKIPAEPAKLFLTGLFSLLDLVLGQTLAELLEKAALPEVVLNALLHQRGPYADALRLVTLGEADAHTEPALLEQALEACGISDMVYLPLAAEAMVWAFQMQAEQ